MHDQAGVELGAEPASGPVPVASLRSRSTGSSASNSAWSTTTSYLFPAGREQLEEVVAASVAGCAPSIALIGGPAPVGRDLLVPVRDLLEADQRRPWPLHLLRERDRPLREVGELHLAPDLTRAVDRARDVGRLDRRPEVGAEEDVAGHHRQFSSLSLPFARRAPAGTASAATRASADRRPPHHGMSSELTTPAWSDGPEPARRHLGRIITPDDRRPGLLELDVLVVHEDEVDRPPELGLVVRVREASSWPEVPPLTWRSMNPALRITLYAPSAPPCRPCRSSCRRRARPASSTSPGP